MYCFNETNCQIFPYLNETECLEMSLCIDAHGQILAGFTPVKERKDERKGKLTRNIQEKLGITGFSICELTNRIFLFRFKG